MNARILWVLLALGAAGCVSKALDSKNAPPSQVRLEPPQVEVAAVTLAAALTVARPRAPSSLASERIAVRQPQFGFDYYQGLRWSDPAPEMLQRLLVTAIARSGRFSATFAAPARMPADFLLDVELRRFEAVYAQAELAPTVVVEAQMAVIDMRSGVRVASFAVAASEAAAANRRAEIVAAFDRATAAVLQDTVARLVLLEAPKPAP